MNDVPIGFFDQEGNVVVKLDSKFRKEELSIKPLENGLSTIVVGDQSEPSGVVKSSPQKLFD